jgi:hypothetical protein
MDDEVKIWERERPDVPFLSHHFVLFMRENGASDVTYTRPHTEHLLPIDVDPRSDPRYYLRWFAKHHAGDADWYQEVKCLGDNTDDLHDNDVESVVKSWQKGDIELDVCVDILLQCYDGTIYFRFDLWLI